MRIIPKYDLDKIKFATDAPTFERAVDLYEKGKITQFEEDIGGYSAVVLGTKPYRVSVEARRYDYGHCECYLGQNNTLLLVDMLLRLDKKLCQGGVDDSDGTVGGFIEEAVNVLREYAKLDPVCLQTFHALENRETCFGWEGPLLELIK